jgi:tRNA(adenine34) deaminase
MQVFLHSPEDWSAAYLDALDCDLPSVAIDLPGFGLSDKPKKDSVHRVAWHAQVLAEFIALHDVQAVHLFAPRSMHALLAKLPRMDSPRLVLHEVTPAPRLSPALRAAPYPDPGHEAGPRALRALLA